MQKIFRTLFFIVIALGLSLGGFYLYRSLQKGGVASSAQDEIEGNIHPYDDARDRKFIVDFFKRNWYWLLADFSEYDPEYMLDHKSSHMDTYSWGNLRLKTYVKDGEPVGFVAWYFKEPTIARIIFLGVSPTVRGQGIGREMIHHAIKSLKKEGAKTILILTRANNKPARHLYESIGFVLYKVTEKYVDHQMIVTD